MLKRPRNTALNDLWRFCRSDDYDHLHPELIQYFRGFPDMDSNLLRYLEQLYDAAYNNGPEPDYFPLKLWINLNGPLCGKIDDIIRRREEVIVKDGQADSQILGQKRVR